MNYEELKNFIFQVVFNILAIFGHLWVKEIAEASLKCESYIKTLLQKRKQDLAKLHFTYVVENPVGSNVVAILERGRNFRIGKINM